MASTYSEHTADGASTPQPDFRADGSWIGDFDPFGTYPGQEMADHPHDDSSTPQYSVESSDFDFTPIDTGYSYPVGNPFSARLYGNSPTMDVSPGQFLFRVPHGNSVPGSNQFSITSALSPSLYISPGGALWPATTYAAESTQIAETTFLPTPPGGAEDDDGGASEDTPSKDALPNRKRKRCAVSSPSSHRCKKRPAAQLRTASRAPRERPNILPQRPTETEEDVKARAAHNQVEQQYRKRLNQHFEQLLKVLPAPTSAMVGGRRDGIGEKRVSKAEVLDLATDRIKELEKRLERLVSEGEELRERLRRSALNMPPQPPMPLHHSLPSLSSLSSLPSGPVF